MRSSGQNAGSTREVRSWKTLAPRLGLVLERKRIHGEFRIRSGETTYPSPLEEQAGEGERHGLRRAGTTKTTQRVGWGDNTGALSGMTCQTEGQGRGPCGPHK